MKITEELENKVNDSLKIIQQSGHIKCKIHGCQLLKGVTNDGFLYFQDCWRCNTSPAINNANVSEVNEVGGSL